jgi:hypothetical protein
MAALTHIWTLCEAGVGPEPVSNDYQMGVKTTYRAHCQDEYIEIAEDPECEKSISGLIPQRCEVHTHPLPGEAPLNVIHSFPSGDLPLLLSSPDLELSLRPCAKR